MTIPEFILVCFAIRLISLGRSMYNEKRLKAAGAIEYGKTNSSFLTMAHIFFYLGCVTEAIYFKNTTNIYTYYGLALFLFSMVMLWWVIFSLGKIWTIKLILSPTHTLKTNFLFKYIRHPNYFLTVIPELIAIALMGNAWITLIIGLPLYSIPLAVRIFEEEKIMKDKFPSY